MNWAQFKDPVSHTCLAGTVVASWSLTQEVAGLSPFTVMANIFVTEFSENIEEKLQCYFTDIRGIKKIFNQSNLLQFTFRGFQN